jgi:hypothetical protein
MFGGGMRPKKKASTKAGFLARQRKAPTSFALLASLFRAFATLLARAIFGLTLTALSGLITLAALLGLLVGALTAGLLPWSILRSLPALLASLILIFLSLLPGALVLIARLARLTCSVLVLFVTIVRHR